jgi:hypothetical protein
MTLITPNTTKESLLSKILEVSRLNYRDVKVVKLEDDDSDIVIFQIILAEKSIKLNDLFLIGIGGLNPSFLKADHGLLITFRITK